jgi:lipopolysaccharide transport system ATP-binding protein
VQGDAVEEFWALKDVSFNIFEGEILGIIGRNGAGKSTLLKVLSRITEPTSGRVTLRGRVASLLEVGTGFHPELTGRENIYLNGAILGMTRAEIRKKFDEIVSFAEIERFLDTPVKRYSSGMYVRLAFAVAAHLEPEILIIDEVLAVGDAEFQRKCLGKMDEVSRREGRTVLFVSHNMTAVQSLCTRAILLEAGSMIRTGPTRQVIEYYMTDPQRKSKDWIKPSHSDSKEIGFEHIHVTVIEEPHIILTCHIEIQVREASAASLLTIDIQDAFGSSIMQAVPSASPFLPGACGDHKVTVEIFSPPLVPGTYWMTFWMGPHHTEKFDVIRNAISFDILKSPTQGRTFPHTPDHGYIVPPSRFRLETDAELLDAAGK